MAAVKQRIAGFTLMELMLVVAVVGMVALLSFPSYQESVRKSKRAEGRVALYAALQAQERYMTQHHQYVAISADAEHFEQVQGPHQLIANYAGNTWSAASWRIAARACDQHSLRECVLLTAFPGYAEADQRRAITALQLNSIGVQSCTGNAPHLCW
jgi:type IV pilus assembly protein PilE